MYGGLFGDLPDTKTKSLEGEQSEAVNDASDAATAAKTKPTAADNSKRNAVPPSNRFMPRFVPTQTKRPRSVKQPAALAPTAIFTTSSSRSVDVDHEEFVGKEVNQSSVPPNVEEPEKLGSIEPTAKGALPQYIDVQSEHDNVENKHDPIATSQDLLFGGPPPIEEPEELRLLHERAKTTDPYDPMIPNDLLEYRQRRAAAMERERLQRLHQESLRQQEDLRRQLEQERHDLQSRGDLDGLVQHRLQHSAGRGRGRGGVSNLPAWLVAKQRKEQELQEPTQHPK
jgi:hypothetical protein